MLSKIRHIFISSIHFRYLNDEPEAIPYPISTQLSYACGQGWYTVAFFCIFARHNMRHTISGEVAERLNALVLKTSNGQSARNFRKIDTVRRGLIFSAQYEI